MYSTRPGCHLSIGSIKVARRPIGPMAASMALPVLSSAPGSPSSLSHMVRIACLDDIAGENERPSTLSKASLPEHGIGK